MNGLKKLFSPSTLAATVASGMLLFSAVNALADCRGMYSVSAVIGDPGSCGQGSTATLCHAGGYHWCCGTGDTCGTGPFGCGGSLCGNCYP